MRLLLFSLLLATGASAQGTGTLAGRVLESDGVTSVIGATVVIDTVFAVVTSNGGRLGAGTNIDGDYRIIGVPIGTYSVSASFVGMVSQTIAEVEITAGMTRQLNFMLASEPFDVADLGCCQCSYDRPLITNDVYQPRILTGNEMEAMPLNR